ncbi:MAG: nucleotidyltransferase domain-containing protein, partial [Rhizobacter sp.]|nr:nucleotidyltransferase domain-containing protein [Rhizobacter sp.]
MVAAATAPTAAPDNIAQLRDRFRQHKAELIERFGTARASAPAATRLLRALTGHVDQSLLELWKRAQMPPDTALLAVGGYGRGELFPYSDVDVLVLLPPGRSPTRAAAGDTTAAAGSARSAIEAFITSCWDIGLEIGSSVRTVDECVAEGQRDVTVQTALLESRYLCGSRRVFNTFRHANTHAMDPKAFLRAKTLEMLHRHQKFEDTPYSLEPNCKESPGGLRDLQQVIWVARAAGLGKNWSALA